jgi:hypothetical protein
MCSIEGCERPIFAKGWCQMHYARWYKYGDPHALRQHQNHGLSLHERFLARVNKTAKCWEWTGSLNGKGYGQIYTAERNGPMLAHRLSYELHCGPVPEGAHVLHKCDNPICVRPGHLFLGDQAMNMADKMAKKRHRYGVSRGEAHGCSLLTEEQVRAIRASTGPSHLVAPQFGISARQVRAIRNREVWRHI